MPGLRGSVPAVRILLVEDDNRVATALCAVLGRHGFATTRVSGVAEALERLDNSTDVVLVDLMLPDGDGFGLIYSIRAARDVPIIVVTARSELRWKLHGLHLGADDYLVKPYDARELIARIGAVVRRGAAPPTPEHAIAGVVEVKGVRMDFLRHEVRALGRSVPLTRKEFEVLKVLCDARGTVVPREQLLSQVWHSPHESYGHTLDVHVAALRAKIGVPDLIDTVRGVGYRLTCE